LKLDIYGYLNRVRSSRRLEAECRRNIEVIWLLQTLKPDFKTIADFRRDHRASFVERTFAWITRWRRLVRDYEERIDCFRSHDPRRSRKRPAQANSSRIGVFKRTLRDRDTQSAHSY
jgi:hypothetical protein